MNGFKFSPRLESLGDRICLSTAGCDVMAVDMFKPGDEAGLIGLLRTGDEVGRKSGGKDDELIGLLQTGDEKGAGLDHGLLLPAVRVEDQKTDGGATERGIIAIMGWDVKPGDDNSLIGLRTGDEKGADLDHGLLLPAIKVGDGNAVDPGAATAIDSWDNK